MAIQFNRQTAADAATNAIQAEAQRCFGLAAAEADIPTEADGIVRVNTNPPLGKYVVRPSDRHIVCLTSGSPITVALPSPVLRRAVNVIANGANSVTVQRADGGKTSFGSSISLRNQSQLFVADGQDWLLGS